MNHAGYVATALTALTAVSAGRPGQDEARLALSFVRSYRQGSETVVDVFCRVPLVVVTPIATSAVGAYRFAVSVRDSAGLELISQSWSTTVRPEVMHARGASTSEHVRFAAQPARYAVAVSVTDSASGRVARADTVIQAYAGSPGASDLLLANDVRQAQGPGDTATRSGEVRHGALFYVTSGTPVLTPQAAKLAYYLELYPARAETVEVKARVVGDANRQVIVTAPVRAALGAEFGATEGIVDLAGLPAGRYRFEVTATGPNSVITRTAPFGMTGFETVAATEAVLALNEWPGGLSEAQLDSAYEPLIYLMTSDELGVFSTLTIEGKRKWLKQFWARRDPTPGTERNEERERYYASIAEADRRFREGGASAIPGWRTDRGRVFVKYGAPDEVLERKVQAGISPYEIWRYTRQKNLRYVFMDLTRFGNYELIYTDDRREPSRPNYVDLLGPDGMKDLEQN